MLVVTRDKIPAEIKRDLTRLLLDTSRRPSPIEISFLRQTDVIPWKHPTPFDLHFSEDWRESFEHDLADGGWKEWDAVRRVDDDLAAHITVTNHRGMCLYGQAIADVFPPVPKRDFLDSILGDVGSAEFGLDAISQYPVYVVLNACRTLAFLQSERILSKEEGGLWALQNLPASFHKAIMNALEAYRNDENDTALARKQLLVFAADMRQELKRAVQQTSVL